MKTMSVGEFKTQFSKVLDWVRSGDKVAVTFGKKREIIGYFTPKDSHFDQKRPLGIMKGKAKVVFSKDFKINEEEFLQE